MTKRIFSDRDGEGSSESAGHYYFLTVLFILLSTKGSFISFYDIGYYSIDLIFIWYGLKYDKFKKSDIRNLCGFVVVFLAFVFFRYFFLNHLPILFLLRDLNFLVKYILMSFLFCAVLKEKALDYIVKITIIGAGISLGFFFIQLLIPDLLHSIMAMNPLSPKPMKLSYANIILFTFDTYHLTQNAGFTWEPGAFGCVLNIGLLLYFYSNNFVFDKKVWILIMAIITTFSTTSYVALVVNLLIYYRGNKGKIGVILFVAVPVLTIVVIKVPFLLDKVITLYEQDLYDVDNMNFLSRFYLRHGGELPLNRFGSMIYIYRLFGVNLLWGISNSFQEVYSEMGNVNISNGLIDFIAKFGLVGLLYLLYKYARLFAKLLHNNELTTYAVLMLLILSFGEPLLIWQNVLVFIFLYKYTRPAIVQGVR